MRSLADRIEYYIKQKLAQSKEGVVEVQRNEIAQMFSCAPSQVTYVLSTRFTLEQGYLVESRRGGGGYLRITRLPLGEEEELIKMINSAVGTMISQRAAEGLIERLKEEGFLQPREAALMRAVVQREAIPIPLPERDIVRSSIIRAMLTAIIQHEFH